MKHIKKTSFCGTIIIILFVFSSAANSSGFIFKWKPFTVDNSLILDTSDKKMPGNDLSILNFKVPVAENNAMDIFDLSDEINKISIQKPEKKSLMDNIKINISPSDAITPNNHEIYSKSDEVQMSKFIDAMTSLIYDDTKIKSVETIGKIIKPQINFYFEF